MTLELINERVRQQFHYRQPMGMGAGWEWGTEEKIKSSVQTTESCSFRLRVVFTEVFSCFKPHTQWRTHTRQPTARMLHVFYCLFYHSVCTEVWLFTPRLTSNNENKPPGLLFFSTSCIIQTLSTFQQGKQFSLSKWDTLFDLLTQSLGTNPACSYIVGRLWGEKKTNVYLELCYGAITKNKPHKTPPFVQFNRLLSMQLHCKNSWVVDFGGLFVAASLEQSRAVCRALICP